MSPVSQKQRGFFGAHKNDPGETGKVTREFLMADMGRKLPMRVKNGKPVKASKKK